MFTLTALTWFLLVWLLGWVALPVARRIWDGAAALPDAGLAAGRVLLLALWTLLAFWLGHVGLPVRWGFVILAALSLAALFVGWRDRSTLRQLGRERWRGMLAAELVFFVVFLFFLGMRGFWPDINNGEKPMDMALISACARADYLPPPNPYAAPTRLGSYYYLGHLETALLTDTIRSTPRWTYNLMAATLPALCFSVLTSLCGAITGRVRNGVLAAFLVLFSGTLEPLRQWFRPLNGMERRTWPIDYMETSRVIPFTINEYPWFTFNYADLHAHYFDMPLALVVFSLCWALYWRVSAGWKARDWLVLTLLSGVLLGACLVTNTWDVPAYTLFLVLGLAATAFRPGWWHALKGAGGGLDVTAEPRADRPAPRREPPQRKRQPDSKRRSGNMATHSKNPRRAVAAAAPDPGGKATAGEWWRFDESTAEGWWRFELGLAVWVGACVLLVAAALLAGRPFLVRLHTEANPPQPLAQPASAIRSWMLLWGLPVGAWVMHLINGLRQPLNQRYPTRKLLVDYLIVTILVVQLAIFFWAPGKTHFVLGYLVLLTIWTAGAACFGNDPVDVWLCRLALCGFLALIWSETTWAGFLGEPWNRQDTVFKFGMQAWYLIGIAAVCGALRSTVTAQQRSLRWASWPLEIRYGYLLMLPVAFTASVATSWARIHHNSTTVVLENPPQFEGWDAWSHLAESERGAAQWLQDHARDGDHLIEAEAQFKEGGDYSDFTRFTHATGVPSVLGPHAHTFQWGSSWAEVDRRAQAVQNFYGVPNSAVPDPAQRQAIADTYQVRYVINGEMERSVYGPPALMALDNTYNHQRVFQSGSDADPQHLVNIYDLRQR